MVLTLVLSGGAALAQTTGDIAGTVVDSAGDPRAGVTIEASSENLQGTRRTITGPDGEYRIPGVPPGVYRVVAAASDFAPIETAATVSLGTTAVVNVVLTLSRHENVVVSGEASFVDPTSTAGGANYTADVVSRLPLNRNYADVVRSTPGAQQDRGQTQDRSFATTIYGASSVENQWTVDGITTTNVQKGFQGKVLNVESVEEVEVKTGGYQAEYGRAIGGVINVITKSGGNELHGDAFLYYDSIDTAADPVVTDRDLQLTEMRIVDYRRTDFGVDLGGFLSKDRLWFFGAYDRVELPAKTSRYESTELVPNTMEFPIDGTENIYSGKLTWKAGRGTTLVATAFADPGINSGAGWADPRQGQAVARPISDPDPGQWDTSRTFGGLDFGLRGNQLFGSSGLLAVQAARHRDRYELEAAGPARDTPRYLDFRCEGGTLEDPCHFPPRATVSGGIGPLGGAGDRSSSKRDHYRADLSLFRGSHEIKVGGDYLPATTRVTESNSGGQSIAILNERGFLYYRHFFWSRSTTDLAPADIVLEPKSIDYGAYVQDSWRIAPGWTINAGLRWDGEDVRNYLDDTVIRTETWQPRLGLVWDPRGDGRTKVYAFAGRFFWALPSDLVTRAFGAFIFVRTYNFDPVSYVHDPSVPGLPRPQIGGGASATPIDDGLSGIYQDEVTVGIERALAPGFSVGLKGTYRRLGRAIEDRCDLDYTRPETEYNTCGIVNPGSRNPIGHGDIPGCNQLDYDFYECTETIPPTAAARRLYRGIEAVVRKSVAEKLLLQAWYVYSSLRGNWGGGVSDSGQTFPAQSGEFNYGYFSRNSYGRLYGDRPHSLRLDGVWFTPLRLWVGLAANLYSGAPLNRFGYAGARLDRRGYTGRMRSLWEADLTLGYPIVVGPATVTIRAYVHHLFNNQFPTSTDEGWSDERPDGYPDTLWDPDQPKTNPYYGFVTFRQAPRLFRASLKISF
jgi:hypothetical protein